MNESLPLSYYFEFNLYDESMRRSYLEEFAVNGAKHLVLNFPLLSMCVEDRDMIHKIAGEMTAAGLSFKDAHAPYGDHYDLGCIFDHEIKSLIIRHKLHMQIAALLNVKTMTFHIGRNFSIPHEAYMGRVCRMLDILLKEAQKCGVIMALENSWSCFAVPDVLVELYEKFACPNLGFCFDSGHANIMDNGRLYESGSAQDTWKASGYDRIPWITMQSTLEKMLPHIVNCHLHDNDGSCDQHRLPGQGNIDWNLVMPMLKEAPRLQVIQSEVVPSRSVVTVRELTTCFNELLGKEY